jgi:GAF domain-containing protein
MPEFNLALVVAKLVEEMRTAGTLPTVQDLNRLAGHLSKAFKVKKGEVAILRLSSDAHMLSFIFPTKLSVIGAIPLTAMHSLAARTIRDKRGEIVNNFSSYRHPTVFEAIDLSAEDKAAPIQKIMSSPMIADERVIGVIQVSRKAPPGEPVGPDFTPAELAELTTVGGILGKFLAELPAPVSIRPRRTSKT